MIAVLLYVDEDAAEHAVVQGLRARGLDVLTTIEAGQCGASDQDQLAFAVQHGRARVIVSLPLSTRPVRHPTWAQISSSYPVTRQSRT